MIAETPNIFPLMLQAIVQQDLPVLSTQSSENSNISYDSDYDTFPTKWDNYSRSNSDKTFPQMFLIEPHVDHLDDEPEMVDPEPIPTNANPAPQQRQQTHFTLKITGFFTIEDVPPQKWNLRFQEFLTWGLSELITNPNVTVQQVLIFFSARLTGTLREFWDSLGEYC